MRLYAELQTRGISEIIGYNLGFLSYPKIEQSIGWTKLFLAGHAFNWNTKTKTTLFLQAENGTLWPFPGEGKFAVLQVWIEDEGQDMVVWHRELGFINCY